METLLETLLRCLNYCKYPKSKMAAQMAASYFDHNKHNAGNTHEVSKHIV